MIDFTGLGYIIAIPACVVVGLVIALIVALAVGPTRWVLAPIAVGVYAGIKIGDRMERS